MRGGTLRRPRPSTGRLPRDVAARWAPSPGPARPSAAPAPTPVGPGPGRAGGRLGRGDVAEAEAEYRAVVAGRVSGLGADDPATLTARYELAGVLSEQADW